MRLMVRNVLYFLVGIATVLTFSGSARAQSETGGALTCGTLFEAKVCTSYQTRAGKITELTLRVPVAVAERAPADAPMVWPPKPGLILPFAPEVQQQIGFTYASIYWEAHGHPPAAYMVPHFDFHFYFVPRREVQTIDCKDTVKPRALPAGYAMQDLDLPHIGKMAGSCIPNMGMHAGPAADVASKTPWKGSMIVGYYWGKPKFFEPMITSAFLLEKHSFSLPVPRDIAPVAHVRYPKKFRAVYHPESQLYDFTFFY